MRFRSLRETGGEPVPFIPLTKDQQAAVTGNLFLDRLHGIWLRREKIESQLSDILYTHREPPSVKGNGCVPTPEMPPNAPLTAEPINNPGQACRRSARIKVRRPLFSAISP